MEGVLLSLHRIMGKINEKVKKEEVVMGKGHAVRPLKMTHWLAADRQHKPTVVLCLHIFYSLQPLGTCFFLYYLLFGQIPLMRSLTLQSCGYPELVPYCSAVNDEACLPSVCLP